MLKGSYNFCCLLIYLVWMWPEMPGVVSVFPNSKRKLHTTHSWDFMGLLDDETMENMGYSNKNQANVIVGFIDTGRKSYSWSMVMPFW